MEYKLDDDLRQRKLRDFSMALKRHQPEEWVELTDLPMVIYCDVMIKSAIEAEWFTDGPSEELDDMTYQEVTELALEIAGVYASATVLEKN